MTDSAAPVRLCCGQRHHGSICPDGKVMCANCFRRFDVADLMVEDGETWDVCKECATDSPCESAATTSATRMRSQCIGWDGAGEFEWAVVIPHGDSPYLYQGVVARFQTKRGADEYIALVEWAVKHGYGT